MTSHLCRALQKTFLILNGFLLTNSFLLISLLLGNVTFSTFAKNVPIWYQPYIFAKNFWKYISSINFFNIFPKFLKRYGSVYIHNRERPDSGPEENINVNFYFHSLCGTRKRVHEGRFAVFKIFLRYHKELWRWKVTLTGPRILWWN